MWKTLPIVENHPVSPSSSEIRQIEQLAEKLLIEHPELRIADHFRPLMAESLEDGPTLHLDDMSDIAMLSCGGNESFIQDRARLRAVEGDFVASCSPASEAFEEYCRDQLGLGSCTWMHPRPVRDPLRLAAACWEDLETREQLITAFRAGRLLYIHPHMGTLLVWELAMLLRHESQRAIRMIAPPPGLTRWVNNKVLFAHVVNRLLGKSSIPCTNEAFNLATLAERVVQIRGQCREFVLKVPNSAGGSGNLVLDAEPFARLSLHSIRDRLGTLLRKMGWDDQPILLIGCWEKGVLSSPSTQLWIPPESSGRPVVEGVYEQVLEGPRGEFAGSRPADFPTCVTDALAHRSWLLARLFQRLGYVGRCSFDLLLVGDRVDCSRVEFVECNGRWGGTSVPMTLMNRLFGDWTSQPYATQICRVPGIDGWSFRDVRDAFQDELFDAPTRQGHLIFYNPGRMKAQSGIDIIALGETQSDATHLAQERFPERLRQVVGHSQSTDPQPQRR